MKIIMSITNLTGKNIAFITDDMITRTLNEIINLVTNNKIEGVHLVSTEYGIYVRANQNKKVDDNLDFVSISISSLLGELKNGIESKSAQLYINFYAKYLKSKYPDGEFIEIDGFPRSLKNKVISKIRSLSQEIKSSAKKYGIDPNSLGAILIDEYVRLGPDDLMDVFAKFGVDTSVGLAQIKLSTARDIITKGYYKGIDASISNSDLYEILSNDETSIAFAAARIKMIIDYWAHYIDLHDRVEIIGTLYSQGLGHPHKTPESIPRGDKIKNEFYIYAKDALE